MRKCDVCWYERETEYKKVEFDYADTGSGKVWWHLCSECRKMSHATMQAERCNAFMREHPFVGGVMIGCCVVMFGGLFVAAVINQLVK